MVLERITKTTRYSGENALLQGTKRSSIRFIKKIVMEDNNFQQERSQILERYLLTHRKA